MTPFTQANFLALIRSAEGTPYKFGGIDPFHGGADCSGLIYWAAKQCGVTLPRTTSAEWAGLPHFTAWQGAPVGSIIEFDVPADGSVQPAHVGVVVGGGFMIDDPHTGAVVRQEAIPNEPGVIWPIGYCLLPFVADVPAPIPHPAEPTEEQIMQAVVVNGVVKVYAASASPGGVGHLLEFTKTNVGWSVDDVTAEIEKANPQAQPFLVA